MNFKIEIVSSAFDNNLYPKGVSCFKAILSYNNINIELYYTYVSNSLNIQDLAQADNHCQNMIIKKAINILQFLNYKINNAFNNEFNNEFNSEFNSDYNNEYNEDNLLKEDNILESIKDKNYKTKSLSMATEYGISIDKLSKISLKINGISNLYELNNSQWKNIYNFIQQKIYSYKSKKSKNSNLIDNHQEYEELEKINIKNLNFKDDSNEKHYENHYENQDNEIILDDEWQEIL